MSERPQNENDWLFEPELIGFKEEKPDEFEEHLQTFEWATGRFIDAFTSAMNGTAGRHFYDAVTLSHTARTEHIDAFDTLSEHMFDAMDRDTAVRSWATIVHGALVKISKAMADIDPRAHFVAPEISDLYPNGLEYFEGLEKALVDGAKFYGVSDIMQGNDEATAVEAFTIQELPELLESEYDENDSEDDEELRDEYGQWVIAEYANALGTHLDNLLELCPPEKYPEQLL